MNARSALFDVYGDHLRSRGGAAPVAALVRLLAPLDVAAPAVRTAVSRMVRQGWLTPVRLTTGPGYRLTTLADHRLATSADRIYRRGLDHWDGRWHVVVNDRVTDRRSRDRLRDGLRFLGYASLADQTWVSPRRSDEVEALLRGVGVGARSFWAEPERGGEGLLSAWDLESLAADYRGWLSATATLVDRDPVDDEDAFRIRSSLVHEWRKFLFTDPQLPEALLPRDWPGKDAATLFDTHAERLAAGAARFVDDCLGTRSS